MILGSVSDEEKMVEKMGCCTAPGAKIGEGGLFCFFFRGLGSHYIDRLISVVNFSVASMSSMLTLTPRYTSVAMTSS